MLVDSNFGAAAGSVTVGAVLFPVVTWGNSEVASDNLAASRLVSARVALSAARPEGNDPEIAWGRLSWGKSRTWETGRVVCA